jgi:hypothetical protein
MEEQIAHALDAELLQAGRGGRADPPKPGDFPVELAEVHGTAL